MSRQRLAFAAVIFSAGIWACAAPANPDAAADGALTDAAVDTADFGSDGGDDAAPGDSAADTGSTSCDGIQQDFWTWDLAIMPPPDVQRTALCRVERPHVRVFATDTVWPTSVSPARAETIARAFEDATPSDPTRGIWPIETTVFGSGPDVDSDPHVALFYDDIGSFRTYTFDGFFRSLDESTSDPHSNQTEMLHLDARPMDPTNEYMLGVVAHEFVHLLAFAYGDEDVWLSEMMAEAGMVMCGYLGDVRLARRFVGHPIAPLVVTGMGADYGPLFLFADYLVERFDPALIGEIAHNRGRGVPTVQSALAGRGANFRDVFGDWTVANLVDATRPPFGYANFDVSTEAAARTLTRGVESASRVPGWTAEYVVLDVNGTEGSVSVSISSASFANLVVHSAVYESSARGAAVVANQTLGAADSTFMVAIPAGGPRRVAIVIAAAATGATDYRVTMTSP